MPSREVARANLYQSLARAFSSPLEMKPEHPVQLESAARDLEPPLQKPALALAAAWKEALKDPEALSLAYARLFLGPFEILASPYASFYLEPNQAPMGGVSQEVARTYEAAGLAPGSGPREAPDHVALEWEFMYFLAYQSLATGEERWREERRRFQTAHLARWMPALVRSIEQADAHPFYSALAGAVTALLGESENA